MYSRLASDYVVKDDPKLLSDPPASTNLLLNPGHMPPGLIDVVLEIDPRALCMLDKYSSNSATSLAPRFFLLLYLSH